MIPTIALSSEKLSTPVLEDGCTVIELTQFDGRCGRTDQIIVLHEGDLVFSGLANKHLLISQRQNSGELDWAFSCTSAWAQRLSHATEINLWRTSDPV